MSIVKRISNIFCTHSGDILGIKTENFTDWYKCCKCNRVFPMDIHSRWEVGHRVKNIDNTEIFMGTFNSDDNK